jgi:hypothetical protein
MRTFHSISKQYSVSSDFSATNVKSLKQHRKINLSANAIQWYNCDLSANAIQWYNCDKCEFKTKLNSYLKQHEQIHLLANAIQWYKCGKCEYKTKRSGQLKQHKCEMRTVHSISKQYSVSSGFSATNVILKQITKTV